MTTDVHASVPIAGDITDVHSADGTSLI